MKDPGEDELDDNALIELLIKGDSNSRYFDIIYSRYHNKIKNKCHAIVKNREESQELAEEIIVKIYEKLNTYKGTSKFSTWVYSLTYNHCIDYMRVRKKLHYPRWDNDQEMNVIPDNLEEINEQIDYDKLMLVMEELHTEEQILIRMRYIDEMSLKTIGQTLRITESAVKMRMKRARTRLLYLYTIRYINE